MKKTILASIATALALATGTALAQSAESVQEAFNKATTAKFYSNVYAFTVDDSKAPSTRVYHTLVAIENYLDATKKALEGAKEGKDTFLGIDAIITYYVLQPLDENIAPLFGKVIFQGFWDKKPVDPELLLTFYKDCKATVELKKEDAAAEVEKLIEINNTLLDQIKETIKAFKEDRKDSLALSDDLMM